MKKTNDESSRLNNIMDTIINEQPKFHRGETEIGRLFEKQESFLPRNIAKDLIDNNLSCYGIGKDVAHFINNSIDQNSITLEIGAGISTLIFAINSTVHTAVTPNIEEVKLIREYAGNKKINLSHVQFIIEQSDSYLPKLDINNLDMVFIDGKHAFPWPIIDWFYTADKLKKDGLMIVDDAELNSVKILINFMNLDPGWVLQKNFSQKTYVFRKRRDTIHNVAWHMQPYTVGDLLSKKPKKKIIYIIIKMIKKIIDTYRK